MLSDLEGLFRQLTRSYETLLKTIDGLTEVQMVDCLPEHDWSIQDTLVHISSNQNLMTSLLASIARGTPSPLPDDFNNQRFNEEQVARGRTLSLHEILKELSASYENLAAVLETVTPEQLTRRGVHPTAGDANVKEFLLAMYAHHEVHCRDVIEQSRRLKREAK